jgi:hypothetical protein
VLVAVAGYPPSLAIKIPKAVVFMTVFHTDFLHCDLIHNGDVTPQNFTCEIPMY